MEKANRRMSLTELKKFIKTHNLNKTYKPDLLLTQSKGNLIKGLIKHGFLEEPQEPQEPLMVKFKIENKNFHELVVYVKARDSTLFKRWFYIEPYGEQTFRFNMFYRTLENLYIIPQLEVNDVLTNESPSDIEEHIIESNKYVHKYDLCSIYKMWEETLQQIKQKLQNPIVSDIKVVKIQSEITAFLKTFPLITVSPYDYSPPKSELEKWKEVGLKSNYLLQQLIKLGGMKYPNLEPILDMVQDIHLPPHTDNDKEIAGIPSGLTNITQTTSINE